MGLCFYITLLFFQLCVLALSSWAAFPDTISNAGACAIIIQGSNNSVAPGACTAPAPNPQPQPPIRARHLPIGTLIKIQAGFGDPARLIARELEIEFQREGFVLDPQRPKMIYAIEVEPRTVGRILDGPDMVVVTITERSTDPTLILPTPPPPQEYPWHNPDSSARYAAEHLYNLLSP